MDMITIDGKLYFKSQNIRVFPCAYRGHYDTDSQSNLVFDPEARATTEANFTNTFHKLSNNKESYVVAWVPGASATNPGTLKCVIGGYYFEIYNHKMSEFFYTNENGKLTPYSLCISTESITLGTTSNDANRTTRILSSFVETTNYLDVKQGNDYAFTGLLISKTDVGAASLAPFIASNYIEAGKAGMVPQTGLYYLNAEKEFVLADGVNLAPGTQLYMYDSTKYTYKVDPAKFPVTNLLDVGSGSYSLRMIEGDTEQGTNTTEASGDYSVALGLHTKATGKASTALGNNTKASTKGAFAAGNHTEASGVGAAALGNTTTASGENAVALGHNTKATAENQLVIGKYNTEDSNKLFIIGNGSSTTATNNIFTVGANGDTYAAGNLTVANNKSTTLGGALEVNGVTTLQDTVTVASGKKTTLGGELEVANATTLQDTLSVATGKATTLGGSLTVTGAATITSTLETKGNILATGTTSNDLILGTDDSGSYGSISVYGESNSKVFETTKNGITTIAGATSITDNTASDSTTTGALTVSGGVGIGGSLNANGMRIGGSATITGNTNVTTVTASGKVAVTDSTDVAESTAALVVTGGAKIGKKLSIGSSLSVTEGATFGGTTTINNNATIAGDLILAASALAANAKKEHKLILGSSEIEKVSGSLTIYGETKTKVFEVAKTGNTSLTGTLTTEGSALIKSTTNSTAKTNGALVVNGGIGVAKTLNVGEDIKAAGNATLNGGLTLASPTSAKVHNVVLGSTTTGDAGSLAIYGNSANKVFEVTNTGVTAIAGATTINDETESNSKTTGALQVAGGVGIAKNLHIGGNLWIGDIIEVAANGALTGLTSLTVAGPVEGTYFNATSYNSISDLRKKCNIEDYKPSGSILDLPLKSFEYKDDVTHQKYIGCIAQDLQQICPEIVNKDEQGYLTIQENKLVYLLLQEVKELKEKIDKLERR